MLFASISSWKDCQLVRLRCGLIYTQWWFFVPWGWGLQAQEHSALARELLPFCPSISSSRGEKLEVLMCLLNVHLTQGGASLLTAKYPWHVMVYNNMCDWKEALAQITKLKHSLTLFYSWGCRILFSGGRTSSWGASSTHWHQPGREDEDGAGNLHWSIQVQLGEKIHF